MAKTGVSASVPPAPTAAAPPASTTSNSAVDDHNRLAYSEIHSDEKTATCAAFLTRAAAFFAACGILRIERVPVSLTRRSPELAEHRTVEPRIVQFKAEPVRSVDPRAPRIRRRTVRKVLRELQHRGQRQLPRPETWSAIGWIQISEVLVGGHDIQPVPHQHQRRPPRTRCHAAGD